MTDSTANGDHNSNDERPVKRRRVAIACQACRDRKSRCDGKNPVCGTCRQMNTACSYPPPLSKTDLLRQEVSGMVGGLEDRIGGIERILSNFEARLAPALAREPPTPSSRVVSDDNTPTQPGLETTTGDIVISEDALQTSAQPGNVADGIAIVPLTAREDCAFFGPSSNIAFLRLVSRALAKCNSAANSTNGDRTEATESTRGVTRETRDVRANNSSSTLGAFHAQRPGKQTFSLPSYQRTRELMSGFFGNCGLVHPYIHEGRFRDTYEEMYRSNFRCVRRSWLALLYMVLALSTLSSPYESASVAYVNAESEVWFNIASDLCMRQVYSETGINIEVAQTLMWMVLYLQSSHSSMKTWVMLGTTVRIAYQLGLHSAEASKVADPVESELRRRTWYGIVVLDCTLSMTYGRPPQIYDTYLTLGKLQLYPDAAQRGNLAEDEAAVGFLTATHDLHAILKKTICRIYNNNSGARMAFNVDNIAKTYTLEGELLQWSKDLPPRLAVMQCNEMPLEPLPSSESLAILLRRQRTVLTLRYLNARILVHRPVLEGLIETIDSHSADLDYLQVMRQAGANSISFAVTCANKLITIMHRLVTGDGGYQQLGAWWFSLYYTFNASLAILGGLYVSRPRWDCPEILSKRQRDSAVQALFQTLGVLDGLDKGHSTVSRCRQYFQELISIAGPLLNDENGLDVGSIPNAGFIGPGVPENFDPNGTALASEPLRQLMSDADLESFLFPVDMQAFSGNPIWD